MKSLRNLIVIVAAVALASVACAQRQGGMRMMGMQDSSGISLLQRKDVQTDLALTDEQKTKLETAQTNMRDKAREMFQGGGAGGDREAMMANFKKLQDSMNAEVKAILTKEQMARLKEINVQVAGNGIILNADIQKELGLTDEQKTKIKDLQTKQQEAMQSVMQKVRDGEIEREEMGEIMAKNTKAMNEELGKVLTDANKAQLKKMGGKEFKADKEG